MSALGWEPRKWSSFAETAPLTFLSKLENMKAPTRALELENYLECIVLANRTLEQHNNTEYETRFFIALRNLLPKEGPTRTLSTDVTRLESRLASIDSKRDPIGMLLWKQEYSERVALSQTSEKINYHRWFLGLKNEYFTGLTGFDSYDKFSTMNAPSPFKEYVEWQRTGFDTKLQQWFLTAPIDEAAQAYRSLLSLHRRDKESIICIQNAAKISLHRLKNEKHTLHLSICTGILYETLSYNSPALDDACANLCFKTQDMQPLLHHAWFGKRMREYDADIAQCVHDWWSRIDPQLRASALTSWLTLQPCDAFWKAVTQTHTNTKVWREVFAKYPVELTPLQQYAIVKYAVDKTSTLKVLLPLIPTLAAAELAAGDKWRAFFLANMKPCLNITEISTIDSNVFDI